MRNKLYSNLNPTVKSFLGNSFIYFIGSTLSKLIGFILIPIYTALISPTDFGYYDLSITYVTIAASALFFDLWISTMRFMYDDDSEKHRSNIVRSGFTIFAMSSVVYILIGLTVADLTNLPYMGFIIAYGLLSNICSMFLFIARGYGKNKQFAVSGIIGALVTSACSLIFLTAFKLDFSGLYIASIMGFISQIIYIESSIALRKKVFLYPFDKDITKEIFIYTFPLIINAAAFWMLTGYNRIVISAELPLSENGIYAIAARFVLVTTLITAVFNYAWQDVLFSKAAKKQLSSFYRRSSNFYMILLLAGGAVLMPIFNLGFDLIVSPAYVEAKAVIPLLIIASLFTAYITFQGSLFHSLKKTKVMFYSMFVACIINVLLCTPLVRDYGLNGAAAASSVGLLVCIIIRMYSLNKVLPYQFDSAIILLTVIIIFASVSYFIDGIILNIVTLLLVSFVSGLVLMSRYKKYTKRQVVHERL